MNTDTQILATDTEEAHDLAERLFCQRYPDQRVYFGIVWKAMASDIRSHSSTEQISCLPGLAVIGAPDSLTSERLKEIAILFETLATKCPVTREEFLPRLLEICEKYGRSHSYAQTTVAAMDDILKSCRGGHDHANNIDSAYLDRARGESSPPMLGPLMPNERSRLLSSGEREELLKYPWSKEIITCSWSMLEVFRFMEKIRDEEGPVLILGETGTGKGLIAEVLHRHSNRAQKSFKTINCASLSQPLVESELFGYVKGSFTDAKTDRPGWLETAGKGVLFLDEIDATQLSFQAKLLRVVREKKFSPVGGTQEKDVDARIIAAAKPNLRALAEQGRFLYDLFVRLNRFPIHVPPLRERPNDIIPITRVLLEKAKLQVAPEVQEALTSYRWPGNVGELENIVARLELFAKGTVITPDHLAQASFDTPGLVSCLRVSERTTYLVALQAAHQRLHKRQGCIHLAYDLLSIQHRPKSRKNFYWRIRKIHDIQDAEWRSG